MSGKLNETWEIEEQGGVLGVGGVETKGEES